ncbi:hypothetical protein [Leifsonia sp. NPDC080035]|uniref:Uncharacterized protein n=1 Tax=Leifsonia sp. NPDC080035 TaxID=3143936 RepID=A0AAU7GCV8_9MICO
MGIDFTDSAHKHGIEERDALHAIRNAVYTSTRVKVTDSGLPDRPRRVFVGPEHAQTDRLIEVLIEMVAGGFVVFHAMPLGSYYRRQMEEEKG